MYEYDEYSYFRIDGHFNSFQPLAIMSKTALGIFTPSQFAQNVLFFSFLSFVVVPNASAGIQSLLAYSVCPSWQPDLSSNELPNFIQVFTNWLLKSMIKISPDYFVEMESKSNIDLKGTMGSQNSLEKY